MKKLLGLVLCAVLYSCTTTCSDGAVCGDGNILGGPSVVPSATPSPSASPNPSGSPTAKCVLSASFATACGKAEGLHGGLVANVQSTMPSILYTEASYVLALTDALKAKGFCATSGLPLAPDEIAIKVSNDFSETYDVWNAKGTPQTLYQQTCTPARF